MFSTKVRHVDFYADEWIAGTSELTLEERGMYITACALIYSRGEPVTRDHLRRVCCVHGRTFAAVLGRLLALGKLSENDGKIGQKRAEKELKTARKRIEKWVKNFDNPTKPNGYDDRAGGNARARTPVTKTLEEESTSVPSGTDGAGAPSRRAPVDHVNDIFARGKRALGQQSGNILGQMRRQYGDLAVIDAIVACEDVAPSNPVAFFVAVLKKRNDRREERTLSPVEKLHLGGWLAAQAYDRKHGISCDYDPPDLALLDG